uniref:Uncharacterized protein n=1 Tax=virus sp. ct6GG30 TaxID=2825804 RepID=A0A8S5RL65_9VIRU|nr:MAG TPA: hypothetical protein [virus sp. ct6GG30]
MIYTCHVINKRKQTGGQIVPRRSKPWKKSKAAVTP